MAKAAVHKGQRVAPTTLGERPDKFEPEAISAATASTPAVRAHQRPVGPSPLPPQPHAREIAVGTADGETMATLGPACVALLVLLGLLNVGAFVRRRMGR